MNTLQKICPFCGSTFDEDRIKEHIGVEHLGFPNNTDFHCVDTKKTLDLDPIKTQNCTKNDENVPNTTEQKYECDFCKKIFRQKDFLKRHKYRVHHSNPKKCGSCKKSFARSDTLKRHIDKEHCESKDRKYKCDLCDKDFETNSGRCKHIKEKHSETKLKYECDNCDSSFTRNETLQRHIKSIHESFKEKCDTCDRTFSRLDSLRDHIQRGNCRLKGKGEHKCDMCEKYFFTRNGKRRHIRNGHKSNILTKNNDEENNSKKKHICDKCDKHFTSSRHLTRHFKSVHESIKERCDLCDITFSRKDSLKAHMDRKICQNNVKIVYKCEKCEKSEN